LSVTLLAAWFLEALAVILVRHRLGRRWLRHPVTLVVLASAVYQGLSPALLTIPSFAAWNVFGIGIQPGFADDAALLTSAAMLAFTIAYLAAAPERAAAAADPEAVRAAARVLDWRWLAAGCAPLAVLTYAGRGYNDAQAIGPDSPLSADLASGFFVVLVVLTAFSFLLRHGTRWFLLVLAAQSAVLAAAGERAPVAADAIALILMLALAGRRPRRRQLSAAAAIALIAVLAITGLRAQQGRALFYTDSGLAGRLSALASGITSLDAAPGQPSVPVQFAERIDGTDFAAGVLQSVSAGQPRLSPAYVPESMLLAVPSSLWPSKLTHGYALQLGTLEIDDFGLQHTNFLSGLPGLYVGFLSAPWLMAFLAFLGLLAGRAERWLFRRCTPVRLVLLAGAVESALAYEQSLPGMLVQLRAAAAIAAVVKAAELAGRRRAWAGSTVASYAPLSVTGRLRQPTARSGRFSPE
jgi:hypothetical protein